MTLTKQQKWQRWKQFIPIYLMALPGLLYLLINNYLPMAGLSIAFRDVNYQKGIWNSDWCGLKNFEYLFATKDAWIITRNTICYNLVFIVLQTIAAIGLAILLNEIQHKFWNRFFQTSILIPVFLCYHQLSCLRLPEPDFRFIQPYLDCLRKRPRVLVHGVQVLALHFDICGSLEAFGI